MPITTARTRPLPRPPSRTRRGRALREYGGIGASTATVISPWNFAVRVWIAFDPPTTVLPTWIEVNGFFSTDDPITITHGRADGMADVTCSTLSATADNSDGRWCASNPAGAWYGLIRKGTWLKVEVLPPSGVVSKRFVGFINDLPTGWAGQYASSQITASDRFERLGQAPAIISSIQSEVLTDPNLTGKVQAYWNLHETPVAGPYGAITFGDTSGNGSKPLAAAVVGGVPLGTGFAANNADGPGFDGLRAVTFNPVTNTTGTYLTAPVPAPPAGTFNPVTTGYSGLYGTVEFWFQTVTVSTQQFLACLLDPTAQFGFSILIDANGLLNIAATTTAVGNAAAYSTTIPAFPRVDDGAWHHLIVGMAATPAAGGIVATVTFLDAINRNGSGGTSGAGTTSANLTQLIIGGGYDPSSPGTLRVGAANICDVAYYFGDLSSQFGTAAAPNIFDHHAAGTTGFTGESTDMRIARAARYAGIPIPLSTTTYDSGERSYQAYNQTLGGWTNLGVGAHNCGTQSMSGRNPLDVMQEAARTEAMPLYVDRSGYLAIQPSTTRQNTTAAWTVDARDLDPGTALPDDFAYTVNQVQVTPNSQAALTAIGTSGAASQKKYGVYSKSIASASVNPTDALNLGLNAIGLGADPPPRLAPLVMEAATLATQSGYGSGWFDAVLATEISTPVQVTNLPSQVGGGSMNVLIEGWTETITAGNIQFSFNTSPVQPPTYQLDSLTLGLLDTPGIALAY